MSKKPFEQRFWERVSKNGPPQPHMTTRCWEWIGTKDTHGYGQLRVKGTMTLMHRFSYNLHYGEIPNKLCVLHECDNPSCVNPNHLWLGTKGDNTRDMERKGRAYHPRGISNGRHTKPESAVRGETHSSAKLTDDYVKEIRNLHAGGTSYSQLAKRYHVGRSTIVRIVKREAWKHIK